ncbi:MAG: segregation/condensation protein A [Lachnospiraceae bacterium]|nr:segregation/condensation protein A [Lachnospiraceae bacterium]
MDRTEITYKLEAFEGPLDLLLHLIEINKIDIYDIPIAEITDQYLEYLDKMQVMDMDLTSDFLVMAATLLRIKSKMMIPVEKEKAEEDGEDPRMELVRRLLEYKMFRYLAGKLEDRVPYAARFSYRGPVVPAGADLTPPKPDPAELLKDYSPEYFLELYKDLLKRKTERIDPVRSRYGEIKQEPVKVTERMADIRTMIRRKRKPVPFRSLMRKGSSREEIVVTFLAILELMKSGAVSVRQDHLFDEIYLTGGANNG